jgi:hypothetical protein
MNIKVEVSVGEFLDKLTILEIKSARIQDSNKLKSINHELGVLRQAWYSSSFSQHDLTEELARLKKVNETLWDIEDNIRDKERHKTFDQEFVDLARSVYINNDERAAIKRAVNVKVGSELIEEKSYAQY